MSSAFTLRSLGQLVPKSHCLSKGVWGWGGGEVMFLKRQCLRPESTDPEEGELASHQTIPISL